MIIQAARCETSKGDNGTSEHVFAGPDNSDICVIQGTRADLADMIEDARGAGVKFAYRHVKISAFEATTREQAIEMTKAYCGEFASDYERCILIEHAKDRRPVGDLRPHGRHWHLLMPEYDVVSERVLDSQYFMRRNEKLGRLFEAKYGHALVTGHANKLVQEHLVKDADRAELEHRFEDAADYRAAAEALVPIVAKDFVSDGYTVGRHQQARRQGWDLPGATCALWTPRLSRARSSGRRRPGRPSPATSRD